MSVICVIPARYNSSRFPGKLLAMAHGKTILQRTLEKARLCPDLDGLYVATDDERIGDHVKKLGGEVLWTSSKPRDGTERIIEALERHPALQKASCIVNLQGDYPRIAPPAISAIVKAMQSDPEAAMSTAAALIRDPQDFLSPHVVKCVFNKKGDALYFSRSPIPYQSPANSYAHIGVYCYRLSLLNQLASLPVATLQNCEDLEQLKILEWGYRIKVALTDERSPSVETPQDLGKLEEYLCQLNTFS